MSVGKGSASGKELRGFVEEIEGVRERKKQLGEAEKAIFAESKAKGFDVKTIRRILILRQQKPDDRQEAQDLLDTYMHALGMAEPPELFKSIGALAVDGASREALIDAFKGLVPQTGEIVLKLGGAPVRLFRDGDGNAQAEDVVDDPKPRRERPSAAAEDEDDKTYAAPGGSRTMPRSHVQAAADRAEASAAAKRAKESPQPA